MFIQEIDEFKLLEEARENEEGKGDSTNKDLDPVFVQHNTQKPFLMKGEFMTNQMFRKNDLK